MPYILASLRICVRVSSLSVVERPIIVQKAQLGLLVLDLLAEIRVVGEERRIAGKIPLPRADRRRLVLEAAVAAGPVLLEPVEDPRDLEPAVVGVVAVARAVGEKAPGLFPALRSAAIPERCRARGSGTPTSL